MEGEPDAVEAMIDWCRRGSDPANVTNIEVEEQEPQGEDRFHVT